MRIIRRFARLMLAWMFIQGGSSTLRKPEGRAATAGDTLDKIRSFAPVELPDDVALVRANAGVQTAAGVALAADVLPRLSAFTLASSLVPTTVGGHPFWTIDDPAQRAQQRIHFTKNLAILGGLLLVATAPHEASELTGPRRRALAPPAPRRTRS